MKYNLAQSDKEIEKLLKPISNDKELDGVYKWIESIKNGSNTNIFDHGNIEQIKTSKEKCYRFRVSHMWRLIFTIQENTKNNKFDIYFLETANNTNAYKTDAISRYNSKIRGISGSEEYSSKEESGPSRKDIKKKARNKLLGKNSKR